MKRYLLYIPLLILFAFATVVMVIHFSNLLTIENRASREVDFPFRIQRNEVVFVMPEAENVGIKAGDKILAINGRKTDSNEVYLEEMAALRIDQSVAVAFTRTSPDGLVTELETRVAPVAIVRDIGYYAKYWVGFLFVYFLPTFSVLLGFWVVFVRPTDPLAWILLFVLLGLSTLSLEMYSEGSLPAVYKNIFYASWALSMLLFGIYFPERWSIDKKLPWLKWIFIIPLSFQIFITLLSQSRHLIGFNPADYLRPLTRAYSTIGFFVNMFAISLFFSALGHKSGTLENPDARRRLKLMVYGTSVALTPFFLIMVYRLITGAKGSYFDVVPFWVALFALLAMLLFPLTMAYVIVVHRAMDVRVVVRQGLQYSLAKGGVRVVQFVLLVGISLGIYWSISRYGLSLGAQIGFIVGGIALIPLVEYVAKHLRVWIDRKFFREAYNAEQILSDLSDEVRTMVETKPLLEKVSAKISESLHVPQIALLLKNGSTFNPAYALGYETAPNVELNETDATVKKLRKNEPLVIYQDDENSWISGEAETDKLKSLNSQLLLPLGSKNELAGVISLSPKLSEEPYSSNDLRLLKSVAAQTGLALENSRLTEAIAFETGQKERLNRELEIAREVQERLFPQELPPIKGIEYYGACRPALGVGGDYYDFIELENGKFGIAIGDVSGKGIGASLMMASLQASLRGQAIHSGDELAALMVHVNRLVYESSTTNRYATFFYAQYDPKTQKLLYVNAGHNPPFLLRKTKNSREVFPLDKGGAVIGMLPSMLVSYEQGEIYLQPGDLIVGFTDGISEAMNPQDEEWGEEAMLNELLSIEEKPPKQILEHIVSAADRFAAGAKQHDDMTMIVIKTKSEK